MQQVSKVDVFKHATNENNITNNGIYSHEQKLLNQTKTNLKPCNVVYLITQQLKQTQRHFNKSVLEHAKSTKKS